MNTQLHRVSFFRSLTNTLIEMCVQLPLGQPLDGSKVPADLLPGDGFSLHYCVPLDKATGLSVLPEGRQ